MTGGLPLPAWYVMPAIAHAIASAHAQGRALRSLGFIAQRLVQMARDGNLSHIHDLSITIERAAFEDAHKLAMELVTAGRTWKQLPLQEPVLLSTTQIEMLVGLIGRYGRNGVIEGFNLVTRLGRWPSGRDGFICEWS